MKHTKNYFKQIQKYQLLSAEEELTLFDEYDRGSVSAFNKLINHNLINVYNIAYKFYRKNNSVQFDDMVSSGNETLIHCINKFNSKKGYRLYAYLYIAVTNTMIKLVNENRKIQLPINKYVLFGKIATTDAIFSDKDKREYQLFYNYLYIRLTTGSLEDDEPEFDIAEEIDDSTELQEKRVADIKILLNGLNEDEQYIINNYFGTSNHKLKLLKKISDDLGYSKGKTSLVKSEALAKMRKKLSK